MADYWVTGWKLSDFSGALSSPAKSTNATGKAFVGTSVTLDSAASQIRLQVAGDDARLNDACFETGSHSMLTHDLELDGMICPAGLSCIEAKFHLTTDDIPPINFIIGGIGTGTSKSGENMVVFTDAPIRPGQTFRFVRAFDGPTFPYETICFAAGTGIETPTGIVPVERLLPGDLVLTRDAGAQPILWAGQRHLSPWDLRIAPHLAPVRIRAGALGNGLPTRDLLVSPQHRIGIDGSRAQHCFGEATALVPARALCADQNVTIDRSGAGISYCHILLDGHHLVRANGQWAETLLIGPEAARAMGASQLSELERFFSEILQNTPSPTWPTLSAGEARNLFH